MKSRTLLSWSGGKDSCLCYHIIKTKNNLEISALLTTVTLDYQRISMHGIRRELLWRQAEEMGLPLAEVMIPKHATNEIYEESLTKVIVGLRNREEILTVAFGDLFLEDIRAYREKFLGKYGIHCEFPIWGRDTKGLARYFIENSFRAKICCVDPKKLDGRFCGREYDREFLSDLPQSVDPCGENGEFHTFVYDGPIFRREIDVRVGEVVERDGFYFADILPA